MAVRWTQAAVAVAVELYSSMSAADNTGLAMSSAGESGAWTNWVSERSFIDRQGCFDVRCGRCFAGGADGACGVSWWSDAVCCCVRSNVFWHCDAWKTSNGGQHLGCGWTMNGYIEL